MSRLVHLASALAAALSLAACAAGPPPASPSAPVLAPPAPPVDLRWRAVRLPQLGATLELPGVPVEQSMYLAKPRSDWLLRTAMIAADEANHHVQFTFSRLDTVTPDRNDDETALNNMPSTLKSVDSRDPLRVGGFRGIAFKGTSKEGHAVSERVVIAGKSLFILHVDAPAGELPVADATRFFDSFRLDLPFQLVSVPDLNCTVALPDAVLPITIPTLPGQGETRMHGYYLGGVGEVVYYVAMTPIAASVRAAKTPDQLLDDAAQALGHTEGNVIHAITPITLDDTRGRDVLCATSAPVKEMHFRVFVAGDRLYQVAIGAKPTEIASDESALRFLSSLRFNQGL